MALPAAIVGLVARREVPSACATVAPAAITFRLTVYTILLHVVTPLHLSGQLSLAETFIDLSIVPRPFHVVKSVMSSTVK